MPASVHVKIAAALLLAAMAPMIGAGADPAKQFLQPPAAARPHTLWMWMNGNVRADGITRDLEAMRRVGLGGALIFNVGEYIPKGSVDYGSREWLELVTHAAREAKRLDLELALHNGPGWSSSGGPWITPEMSMQQLVWSETKVVGPGPKTVELPRPFNRLNYYRDVCVLAFPSPLGEEKPFAGSLVKVTGGRGGTADKKRLTDGDLATGVSTSPQEPLIFEFHEPFEARAITVWPNSGGSAVGFALEAGDDGTNFRKIAQLTPPGPRSIGDSPLTETFEPVRARCFRLTPARSRDVLEVEMHTASRIAGWHYKANFSHRPARYEPLPAAVAKEFVIDPANVRDLSAQMDSSGRLTWDVPAGAWTIVRFGHTPRGQQNIAAPEAGIGLECDKLSASGIEFHFQRGIDPLLKSLGRLCGQSFTALDVDSYEVGMQNWTASFPADFKRQAGYDLLRYLPAMTGRFVGSAEMSEKFLWDLRRVQAEMVAKNYYGRLRELCRAHRLKLYVEPYGAGPGDYDELEVGGRADVPMGEFWTRFPWDDITSIRLAASVAHTYDRTIAAGESFTAEPEQSRWLEYPYALKSVGDLAFSLGLNQIFFHRFAHQPHPAAAPGMTMGPWGIHFDRTTTWFEQSGAWIDYLARCQFLLRQGKFVADVLYFTGEGSPQMSRRLQPTLPAGYTFDAVDAEVLLSRVRIEKGRIVLPGGASYRMLVLPSDLTGMTTPLLQRLNELVRQGMTLVGPRPSFSPSLRDHAIDEFNRLISRIWDGNNERVFASQPASDVLRQLNVEPDFEYLAGRPDAALVWLHRRLGDTDIYFVANRQRRSEDVTCSFRVEGKRPEFWWPDTGEIQGAAIYDVVGHRVRVPIHLDPAGSVFVVFRDRADDKAPRRLDVEPANVAERPPAGITNNFTIAGWIKPDTNLRTMPRESLDSRVDENGKSYVVPAPDGETLFGAEHSGLGIAAGRNGIFVLERMSTGAVATLVSITPISGWTHLAVVCRDGKPSLYLNGLLVREGLKSGRTVHPGIGAPPPVGRSVYYFEGESTLPELFPEALDKDRIAGLANRPLPAPDGPPAIELERAGRGGIDALIWQSGRYVLEGGRAIELREVPAPIELNGPWSVTFPPDHGAPSAAVLPELRSLHLHTDPGIRNFSGIATYRRDLIVAADALARDRRVFLDLGRVEVGAEVIVNRKNIGILWKPPYRADITSVVRAGINKLEIRVAALWPNRLIGDEQLPAENAYNSRTHAIERLPDWYRDGQPKPPGGRTTFTTWQFFTKTDPLVESGLLGPVRLFNPIRRSFPSR